MVISAEALSLRLLTASMVIAIEPEIVPTAALKAASRKFVMIPMILVLMMIESLRSFVFAASSLMKVLSASCIVTADILQHRP